MHVQLNVSVDYTALHHSLDLARLAVKSYICMESNVVVDLDLVSSCNIEINLEKSYIYLSRSIQGQSEVLLIII